ncbi:MAG TPA: molybdenum cofactor biosynthesis protein MoaE [Fibrobacteria bacterium]|nr:molybdenum cofactor biosynthesis protein MoaE [Fibrobacteria bacterium]
MAPIADILSAAALDREALRAEVSDPAAGAVLLFEGTVRDHSEGLTGVVALEYEAHVSMAVRIIAGILEEVRGEIPVRKIAVRHRLGRVELGEPTILIAVSAAHRDEAYRASRAVIDRIKHEAPIWKREILRDGSGTWSKGCTAHRATEEEVKSQSAKGKVQI